MTAGRWKTTLAERSQGEPRLRSALAISPEQWWSEGRAHIRLQRARATLLIQVDETWSKVEPFIPTADQSLASGHAVPPTG